MAFANKRSKAPEFAEGQGVINRPTGFPAPSQASSNLSQISLACLNTSLCMNAISISPVRKRSLHDGFRVSIFSFCQRQQSIHLQHLSARPVFCNWQCPSWLFLVHQKCKAARQEKGQEDTEDQNSSSAKRPSPSLTDRARRPTSERQDREETSIRGAARLLDHEVSAQYIPEITWGLYLRCKR